MAPRDSFGRTQIISAGRHLTGSSPTGRISSHALWQLLCKSHDLTTLELCDLACISNHNLEAYENLQKVYQQKEQEMKSLPTTDKQRFAPYRIPQKNIATTHLPGSSIRHLIITKYMTTPLSKPGFESLLKLFPKLNRLEYETNFYAFDNLFEGMSQEMFNAERIAVKAWSDQRKEILEYKGQWNANVTPEQRLMAGMASVSSETN